MNAVTLITGGSDFESCLNNYQNYMELVSIATIKVNSICCLRSSSLIHNQTTIFLNRFENVKLKMMQGGGYFVIELLI